jgi:hypothetical protein
VAVFSSIIAASLGLLNFFSEALLKKFNNIRSTSGSNELDGIGTVRGGRVR